MMTPFLVLTVLLTITQDATVKQKRALAIKVTVSVIITCVVLLFFGNYHVFLPNNRDNPITRKPLKKTSVLIKSNR